MEVARLLRWAWRRNRSSPGWWLTVVLLGLSAGALAAASVLYDAVVRRPVPVIDAQRAAVFGGLAYGEGIGDAVSWWSRAEGVEHLSLYHTSNAELSLGENARRWVRLTEISGSFFENFSHPIDEGRTFTRDDELRDMPVAVVSRGVWNLVSAGRSISDGVRVSLGGATFTIVGIADRALGFPSETQIWVTKARIDSARPSTVNGVAGLPPIRATVGWLGTLKPGVTLRQAEEQMLVLLREANEVLSPKTGMKYGDMVGVKLLIDSVTAQVRPAMQLLMMASGAVFLLCLANCAALILARATSRARELAICRSLGASDASLAWDAIAESVVLSAWCTVVCLPAVVVFASIGRTLLYGYRVYATISAERFAGAVWLTVAAGAAAGLVSLCPLWFIARRTSLLSLAKGDVGYWSVAKSHARFQRLFVALAASVSTLLLAGAGVTAESLRHLLAVDLGYEAKGVLTLQVMLPRSAVHAEAFARRRHELLEIGTQNGLENAAIGAVAVAASQRGFHQVVSEQQRSTATVTRIDGPYFAALKAPLVAGRAEVSQLDEAVVNESVAKALWPNRSPLGQSLAVDRQAYHVVGIVANTRTIDQKGPDVKEVYLAFDNIDGTVMPSAAVPMQLIGRCANNCQQTLGRLTDRIRRIEDARLLRGEELSNSIAMTRGPATTAASVWAIYGALATCIGILGVAALMMHSVSRRRVEIGVRMALGGTRFRVVGLLASEGLMAVVVGIVVGAVASACSVRALKAMTLDVAGPNVGHVVSAAVVLVILSTLAAVVPAVVATRRSMASLLREN